MITQAQKDQWLKDLRSGAYKQCSRLLYKDGAYCALGVLNKGQGDIYKDPNGNQMYNFPSAATKLKAEEALHVVRLNDRDGKSFDDIANWVEKNVEVEHETATATA